MSNNILVKKIPLTKGKFALVDSQDFKWLKQWKWCFSSGYAERGVWDGNKIKKIKMHRIINQTPQGLETDHINRNTLDNRRSNLRTVNRRGNAVNGKLYATNTSGIKGVYWHKETQKWRAMISDADGKLIHLGLYFNINDAQLARDQGEQLYYR